MTKRKQKPNTLTNKTCKQMTTLLADYLNGRLGAKMKKDFEQHLSICPDCVSFLNTYRETAMATKSLSPAEIPERVRENILEFLRRGLQRAGAFVIYVFAHLTV
ncbi:MAG TPA: zf-HC2 domain-containing protein [Candidatus Limnocylindria bacterium]|nr:zf-HC2 domain-containing protein [Candidatus Limnocylindria bacterium]